MALIRYNISTGILPITVSLIGSGLPDNVHYAYGEYSFTGTVYNAHSIQAVDAEDCLRSICILEDESYIDFPDQVMYRNLEGNNMLPSVDYGGRTLPLETPILLVEKNEGSKWYVIENVPTIPSLLSNPEKWGLWDMTYQAQPDTAMRKVTGVEYLGTYSGHTNCARIYTYDIIASAAVGHRMTLMLPTACNVTIKNSVEIEKSTGNWNATYVIGAYATWKHSDGTYHAIAAGYNSASATGYKVKHHHFTAPTFMGTWTDTTGAANGDMFAGHYPIGYVGFNPNMSCFPIPGRAGYYAMGIALVKASGVMDYGVITFDEDLSDITSFKLTIDPSFTPAIGYSFYEDMVYFNGKYYYQIQDGAYNSGKRIILSCDTIDGSYVYDSTMFDFADERISNNGSMMVVSVGTGSFKIIGGRLYYFCSGQGGDPYTQTGNYNNHECFLWVYNNCCEWHLVTVPFMTAQHGAAEFGFTWGKDHLGGISNFIIEDHKAYFLISMLESVDAYHASPGYIQLGTDDNWLTGCGVTTTSTTFI